MPPRVKFTKEEIVRAALNVARKRGIDAVTARDVAAELGVSPRPIFTYYGSMEQLREDVCLAAQALYRETIEQGLSEPIPFQGIWRHYLAFARREPELYRLLFLSGPGRASGGAAEAMKLSQDLARESIMRSYAMNEQEADGFFRDLWLTSFGFAALIVTGDCPYTDEEILKIGAEISLSVCKAYKEIPGLARGDYDRDAVFTELLGPKG